MHLQAVVRHIGEVKQIHTHKGPSDKTVFLHTAPSVKSTTPSPPLFHQEDATKNISSVITTVIFTTFVCSAFQFQCQVLLRNAVLYDISRNIG
jgi:hypothetical protein